MLQIFSSVSWLNDHIFQQAKLLLLLSYTVSSETCQSSENHFCFLWVPWCLQVLLLIASLGINTYCRWHVHVTPCCSSSLGIKTSYQAMSPWFSSPIRCHTDKLEFFMEQKLLNGPWRSQERDSLPFLCFLLLQGSKNKPSTLTRFQDNLTILNFLFPFPFFFLSFLPSSLFPFLLFFLPSSLFPSIPPSFLSSFSVCLLFLHVLFLRNGPQSLYSLRINWQNFKNILPVLMA